MSKLMQYSTDIASETKTSGNRFTINGDDALESHLSNVCKRVRHGVLELLPENRLEAILLGGGYGRGEGGVFHTVDGDTPYNDLEFYIFMRGNTFLNERRHGSELEELAHSLTDAANVEVEFKLLSLAQLRRRPVSMFSYDLIMGHHWVFGWEDLLVGCGNHKLAENIPYAEIIRLLLNRCSGLLFARERFEKQDFSEADADFIWRNMAKVRLALGDAVLATSGHYHWSCRERFRRLRNTQAPPACNWFDSVVDQHGKGNAFKLNPWKSTLSKAQLHSEFQELSLLAGKLWLWIEEMRLIRRFASWEEYSLDPANKCPEMPVWRNPLINLRRFGPASTMNRSALRYPRERLLRTLPLLLWNSDSPPGGSALRLIQHELDTNAGDIPGLITAYRRIWEWFR